MSGTATRRTQAERTERTRKSVIEATIQTIANDGYQGATTRRIAGAAGVSLGAIAHHFPTRAELIGAALSEVSLRVADAVTQQAEHLGDSNHLISELLDTLWSNFSGTSFRVWVRVWLAASADEDLRDTVIGADREMSDRLARAFALLTPDGQDRNQWMRRVNVALDAIRGLSLMTQYQPGTDRFGDRWEATRTELERLLRT